MSGRVGSLDEIASPGRWNEVPSSSTNLHVDEMVLTGSFYLKNMGNNGVLLPKSCCYWVDGEPPRHIQLIVCPGGSITPYRLRTAAMRGRVETRSDDQGESAQTQRCVIEELFGPERDHQREQNRCHCGDFLMPKKVSCLGSLASPMAVKLWMRGLTDNTLNGNSATLAAAVFNQVGGSLVAILILFHMDALLVAFRSFDSTFQAILAAAWTAYSSGTPLGIKLHTELATILTQFTLLADFLRLFWAQLLSSLGGESVMIFLALIAGLLGLHAFLSFACDLLTLALHLPFRVISVVSSHISQYHLFALRYSWTIMRRGKKRREESLSQDPPQRDPQIEHIVCGVLLFTPLLALSPTTAAFHCLTLITSLATYAPCALILCVANLGSILRDTIFLSRGITVTLIHTIETDAFVSVYELKV